MIPPTFTPRSVNRAMACSMDVPISSPNIMPPLVPGAGCFAEAGCNPMVNPFPASTVAQ
jgi:hypothetical protein